jgi:uncharacterized coiled-coil protein SlyX
MEQLIGQSLQVMPVAAIPVVIVVLGLYWIYRKTMVIQKDRELTKKTRDADSTELHDKILKHDFLIGQLKDNQTLQAQILEDLRDAVSAMNIGVAKLEVSVTTLTEAVKELKK